MRLPCLPLAYVGQIDGVVGTLVLDNLWELGRPVKPARRLWLSAVQFLFGVLVVAGAGLVAWRLRPQPDLPQGWLTIRPPVDTMALLEVGDTIWSGGRDGVAVLDRDGGVLLEWIEADVPLQYVTSLATDGVTTWVGHDLGLSGTSGGEWHTLTVADGLPDNHILALCYSPASGLWVGTGRGLANFRQGPWAVYGQAQGLASDVVSVILEDSRGRLWAGNGRDTVGGLSMLAEERWQVFTTSNGLAHNVVNAILEMPDGGLWFGTGFSSRGGASHFDGRTWLTLTQEDGLAGAKVRSLFLDAASVLWFGSEYDGLARYDGRSWQIYTPENGLAGWEVKAMLQDSRGNLWLGTENGLTRISRQAWETLSTQP